MENKNLGGPQMSFGRKSKSVSNVEVDRGTGTTEQEKFHAVHFCTPDPLESCVLSVFSTSPAQLSVPWVRSVLTLSGVGTTESHRLPHLRH